MRCGLTSANPTKTDLFVHTACGRWEGVASMPRIRTIKPEFPQSESMGRVSREARLCFVLLWTLADDEGRLRGSSRILASLLFPYDDDAKNLIDGWLSELIKEGCIVQYQVERDTYIQIINWLEHQKIDRPSQSKIPAFDESSRTLANPRESSSLDQGREGIKEGTTTTVEPVRQKRGEKAPGMLPQEVVETIKRIAPTVPKEDPQGRSIKVNAAVLAERLTVRFKENPWLTADIAFQAWMDYLATNPEWIKAPHYFFGNAKDQHGGAHWEAYARLIVHKVEKAKLMPLLEVGT